MGYSTLMVQLELGRSNAAPLGVTRDLARRLEASVMGIAAAQPIRLVVGEGYYAAELIRQDADWIEQQGKAAEREFRAGMAGIEEASDWDMAIAGQPLSDHVAAAAGPCDLVVAGVAQDSGEKANSTRRVDIDDLVMKLGRPVLVVPPGVHHFDFRCAVVAWKKSRESRRALTDSLPLLRQMEKVVIAAIAGKADREKVQADLDGMVAWLARQGVVALSRLEVSDGHDGERLLALAEEEGADLIVAGAYGHARFREWVLGGVTRKLLRHSGRCLLLSH